MTCTEARSDGPEGPTRAPGSQAGPLTGGELLGKAKPLLAAAAALGGGTYALGYVINVMHLRMLGVVSEVDLTKEEIIFDGVAFWGLTPLSWLAAIPSTLGCLLWAFLLAVLFGPPWWRRQRVTNGWACRLFAGARRAPGREEPSRPPAGTPVRRLGACLGGPVARCVPLLLLILLVCVSLKLNGMILEQDELLFVTEPAESGTEQGFAADDRMFRALTGYAPQLRTLLADKAAAATAYGCLSLLAFTCAFFWVQLARHRLCDPREPGRRRGEFGLAHALLAASGFLVVMQLAAAVAAYGFLMPGNRFPMLEVPRDEAPVSPASSPGPDARELVLLGRRGTTLVAYCPEARKLLWIDQARLARVARGGPRNVFAVAAGPADTESRDPP